MNQEAHKASPLDHAPEARVQTKRSFSIVWVVPILALLIGGWMTFKALSEKGPKITISFETADGLQADKTVVKFKDVDVGKVTKIELNHDRSDVLVTVEMTPDAESYLTDKTQFWVVRAKVAAGEVTGLGTLLSGAYIGINPSIEGKKTKHFKGLEKAPILTAGLPGRHFILESKTLGSLDLGSPVYYRGIKVGQVVDYNFDEHAEAVLLKVFISDPFHKKVRTNTIFWNASGIDFSMDATGLKMDTQSLASIMLGGVAFDQRKHELPSGLAEEDHEFLLYENQESSNEVTYNVRRYLMMYFEQSVRGLSPGAPVEIKGIKVGEVISVELQFNKKTRDFLIPVLVYIEPERFHELIADEDQFLRGDAKVASLEEQYVNQGESLFQIKMMIEKGYRAQLKTANLLTGQLYIDLDYYPDASVAEVRQENGYTVFPTASAPLEQLVNRLDKILKKIEQVPFDKIGVELQTSLVSLTTTLNEIKLMTGNINRETTPKINAAFDSMNQTMAGIETTLGPDSALNYKTRQVANELFLAIRSLRSLLEYLERDPQALILGKEGDKK